MTRILFIDDETINHQLVARALEPLGFQMDFANNGTEGLAKARTLKPDVVITDVMMPDINGYEVTRLLRRENQFAPTPILILTAQAGLQDKLKAFEAGADDYLTKPFEGAELAARITALLRRMETARGAEPMGTVAEGRMIAIHSLRGGTGSSSLAVNLGVGLSALWPRSTILLDLNMTAGQVALMLNMTLRRTWSDIAHFKPGEMDKEALDSIVTLHESGLSLIAAPTLPAEGNALQGEILATALGVLRQKYEYILADLSHDFGDIAVQALDAADSILIVATPDMASIRAVSAAMDTYSRLGYPPEKLKLVLNATFPHAGLPKEKIEAALGVTAVATIPYVQDVFVEGINYGRPPVFYKSQEPIAALLEDFAFYLSKDEHKKTKPKEPSEAWTRVYKRFSSRRK